MSTTSLQLLKKEDGRTFLAEHTKTIPSADLMTFVLLSGVHKDLMFIKEVSLMFRICCQWMQKSVNV